MPPAIPIATYRLQLDPQFGFDEAAAIVPYLKALGISHLYASPFLKARSGTTHGYDVIDHAAVNPEFGGEAGFRRMSDALAEADMGLILDFVPNHMAVHHADNTWWLDTLEWGPRSPYAKFFDIDWDTATGQHRVLLPILGRSYGEVLESGELELRYDPAEGSFSAWYFDHRLPINPGRFGEVLQKVVTTAAASDEPAGRTLLSLATRYKGPRNPSRDLAGAYKRDLATVAGGAAVIARGLKAYRPGSGEPGALQTLHYLLERQHFRAAYWRLAGSEINYRRFFDINSLAGLRVEERDTFDAIHKLVFRLIEEGRLQGLRLDHIDGLRDPHQYFRRLQQQTGSRKSRHPVYVIVEKILAEEEALPRFAGVSGTTGYEWLNLISHVLLDNSGRGQLDRTWREIKGVDEPFELILRRAKRRVLQTILLSEFTVLARLIARIAAGHYSTRDYTADALRAALEFFILNFPVYRTYITASGPSARDRQIIDEALDRSRAEWFGTDIGIFDFLNDALTLDLVGPGRATHSLARVRRFAFKVQQFTGPMLAKSLEDTAFYRYHRHLALNEVGGRPDADPLSLAAFHERMRVRTKDAPHGLTATATHDTKRGEDARARLIALSELADEWDELVKHWRNLNSRIVEGMDASKISAAHEYMIYQALLGAWPFEDIDESFVVRVQAFVIKAAREGKEQTSWLVPNESYELNLTQLVKALLDETRSAHFISSFSTFAHRCALLGVLNGLTQLTLKMTLPGVPDIYQGTEFWDLSFVDPDNRRAVDFPHRLRSLRAIGPAPDWAALARDWRSGEVKHALTQRLLALRNTSPQVFVEGSYRPIAVSGPHSNEVIAFAREHRGTAVIVATARHFSRATQGGRNWPARSNWDAILDLREFRSARDLFGAGGEDISGRPIAVAELFRNLPLAILRSN